MDKFLFTDGTNGVKEVHTAGELLSLINSTPEPGKARVWIFNSNEWVSCSSFLNRYPGFIKKEPAVLLNSEVSLTAGVGNRLSWLKKIALVTGILTGALLVFNFTSAKWEKATPLKASAARPANVPAIDLDSLINEIEVIRGKLLDKGTRYNLRLRNNWPEHILLQLKAEKETKGSASHFFNITVSIDNATGYLLDNAQVKLHTWKNGKATPADTLLFGNIRYDKLLVRQLASSFRCDSISASFQAINAKAFNFCYSAAVKNNSGNYNDRWFCRDGKMKE